MQIIIIKIIIIINKNANFQMLMNLIIVKMKINNLMKIIITLNKIIIIEKNKKFINKILIIIKLIVVIIMEIIFLTAKIIILNKIKLNLLVRIHLVVFKMEIIKFKQTKKMTTAFKKV